MSKLTFWSRVNKTSDCWIWLGAKNKRGQGRCTFNGIQTTAHRVAWILTYGSVLETERVLQSCGNRLCVKPEHLKLGSDYAERFWRLADKSRTYALTED